MIGWFLDLIGVHEVQPPPIEIPVSPFGEHRLEQARQIGEQTINLADRETEKGRQKLVSWQDLFDPGCSS